jgi:hypothetical protein
MLYLNSRDIRIFANLLKVSEKAKLSRANNLAAVTADEKKKPHIYIYIYNA